VARKKKKANAVCGWKKKKRTAARGELDEGDSKKEGDVLHTFKKKGKKKITSVSSRKKGKGRDTSQCLMMAEEEGRCATLCLIEHRLEDEKVEKQGGELLRPRSEKNLFPSFHRKKKALRRKKGKKLPHISGKVSITGEKGGLKFINWGSLAEEKAL